MSDTLVLRPGTAADAPAIVATIAAAFTQYRGKLVPESSAFRETPEAITEQLAQGSGAIVAERNGAMIGCVMRILLKLNPLTPSPTVRSPRE